MKKICAFFIFLLLAVGSMGFDPNPSFHADTIGIFPILENGRVKPLETFANDVLLQFSGKRYFQRQTAAEWLGKVLFDPDKTKNDSVFLINHPDVVRAVGREPRHSRRYSFAELENGIPKLQELASAASSLEEKDRSPFENEVLRVYQNLLLYMNLSVSMRFAEPTHDFSMEDKEIRRLLQVPTGQKELSYVDAVFRVGLVHDVTDRMMQKDPAKWSPTEQHIFQFMGTLTAWSLHHQGLAFRVIPSPHQGEEWLSPWDAVPLALHHKPVQEQLLLLTELGAAYRQQDQALFNRVAARWLPSVRAAIPSSRSIRTLRLECVYNKIRPFSWACGLYALAFLLSLMCVPGSAYYRTAFSLVVGAFFLQSFGLVCRIILLQRPPVSSLYETFIFVSWVSVLLGLMFEKVHRAALGLIVASAAATLLLFIAGKFSAEGDTLRMLVAVLNSNFWLSTHVVAITTGYAGCCVAGILGHLYLIRAVFFPMEKARLEQIHKIMMGSLMFGLLFSSLGTALGGIWADQSWGRFWGWDPKENGALMIVLWCAIIFHARIAGFIHQIGTAAACAAGLIVVMWAWFGINLLGVGLHSYGWTSGIALHLMLYVMCELLFLMFFVTQAKKKSES